MINPTLLSIIVNKIKDGKINDATKEPFKLEDIINAEYKSAVEQELNK